MSLRVMWFHKHSIGEFLWFNCSIFFSYTEPRKPTLLNADIVFVVDSSSSVSALNYEKEKEIVKKLSKYLNVNTGASRVAFITYGEQSKLEIRFDDDQSFLEIESQIDDAPYVGGERRMDIAIKDAQTALFVSRPSVPKIVILFTAGRQSSSISKSFLENAANALGDMGAKTYVIAVGPEHDRQDLRKIADPLQSIIEFSSFDRLLKNVPSLAKDIASATGINVKKLIFLFKSLRVTMIPSLILISHYLISICSIHSINISSRSIPALPLSASSAIKQNYFQKE